MGATLPTRHLYFHLTVTKASTRNINIIEKKITAGPATSIVSYCHRPEISFIAEQTFSLPRPHRVTEANQKFTGHFSSRGAS